MLDIDGQIERFNLKNTQVPFTTDRVVTGSGDTLQKGLMGSLYGVAGLGVWPREKNIK